MSRKSGLFRIYWDLYGGSLAVFRSNYFYAALILTFLCQNYWLEIEDGKKIWPSTTLSIIPNLMAFSLGGMAIFLSFSNSRFLELIQRQGNPRSLYMRINATFFHFIFIQAIALCFVFLEKSINTNISSMISTLVSLCGFFFTVYGMLGALATAALLLQMARVFNAQAKHIAKDEPPTVE